ncbi:uncharacterized protein TNCV_4632221 [Trichonephila clavipes]|nr:uncharacterized protein TNCV_4632221 [Trichonephila clavipes]
MVCKGRCSQSSSRNEIKNVLEDLIEDSTQTLDTRVTAEGFRKTLESFQTTLLTEFYPYCIEDTDKSTPEKIVLRINLENEEAENFKNRYSVVSNTNWIVYGCTPNPQSYEKVRYMPKNLTPEQKIQCLGAALTFLQRYHEGDQFLDRIVTGDETWLSNFTPETKQQSMHWRQSGSPVRMKFKQML